MKKKILVGLLSLLFIGIGVIRISAMVNPENVKIVGMTERAYEREGLSNQEYVINEEENIALKDALDGIDIKYFDLNINQKTTKPEIINIMHKMTHQKIRAEEKWGAIPMHSSTIEQLYLHVTSNYNSSVEDSKLIRILEDWRSGDFSNIDSDHNYFWSEEDGNIGRAFGRMTVEDEIDFIEKYFH